MAWYSVQNYLTHLFYPFAHVNSLQNDVDSSNKLHGHLVLNVGGVHDLHELLKGDEGVLQTAH